MNKVFFCDLDGTLIKIENGKQKVSEENVKFINEYQSNGNEFIIASGRNATSIEQIKHDYKIHTNYLIADNGAIVLKRNEVIFTKKIKKEIAKSIIDLVQGQELQLFFSNGNKTFAEKCKEDLWAADKSRNIVDDIYEEFEKNETITKLSFYAKKSEPELYKLAQKYAKEIKDKYGEYLEVCDASTDFFIIDIQAKNVSKGTAIKWLLDTLEHEWTHTACAGDAMNDYTMFQTVDKAYKMIPGNKDLLPLTHKEIEAVFIGLKDHQENE